jgi:hypothetical protein
MVGFIGPEREGWYPEGRCGWLPRRRHRRCCRAAALGDEAGTAPRSCDLEDETRAAEMISGCRSSNRFTKLDGELRSIDMELVMVKKKKSC